jgi:hypothetical protein
VKVGASRLELREIEGTDGDEPGARDVETRQTGYSGGLQRRPGLGSVQQQIRRRTLAAIGVLPSGGKASVVSWLGSACRFG